MKKTPILFIFFAMSVLCNAQSSYQYGIMPTANILNKLPGNWSTKLKIESRQSLYYQEFKYDYVLTEASIILSNRIAKNITVGGGYLLRVEDDAIKNRAIQQISYSKKYHNFRMAHRLRLEQTFEKDKYIEFGIRYRISAEIPLEGQTLDVKEFYLKLNNEYINSWQKDDYDLEIRCVALLGHTISDETDLEVGIDYRLDSFVDGVDGNSRNRIWLSINFFYSF